MKNIIKTAEMKYSNNDFELDNMKLNNSNIFFNLEERDLIINKLLDILKIDIIEIQFSIIKDLIESLDNNLIKLLFTKFEIQSSEYIISKMIILLEMINDELLKDRDNNIFLIILIEFYIKSIKIESSNQDIDDRYNNNDELFILLDELLENIHFDYDRNLLIEMINNKEDNKEIIHSIF